MSNQLQTLPPSMVAVSFVFNSIVVGFFWLERDAAVPALQVALGVLITVCETRWKDYLPSPTGIGMAMLMPGTVVFSTNFT